MKAGLLEIVRSLNRSWIYDTYFSLCRAIHPGRKSGRGKCPGWEMFGYHKTYSMQNWRGMVELEIDWHIQNIPNRVAKQHLSATLGDTITVIKWDSSPPLHFRIGAMPLTVRSSVCRFKSHKYTTALNNVTKSLTIGYCAGAALGVEIY